MKKKKDVISPVFIQWKRNWHSHAAIALSFMFAWCLRKKSFCFLLPLDSIVFCGDHLLLKKKKQKNIGFVKSINANFFFLNSWGCLGDGDGKIDLGKVMSPFVESQFESSQSKQPIFVRPPLVSLRNDVWATTAEMSHFRVPKISLSKRGCVELCCENEFYLHHN